MDGINGEFLVNIARLGTHLDRGRSRLWQAAQSVSPLVSQLGSVSRADGAEELNDGRHRAWSFISLTV